MIGKITSNILKQTYTKLAKVFGVGLFIVFLSCESTHNNTKTFTESNPTSEEVHRIYSHYVRGHFSEFVNHIASCQGKPRFYREQIINLYKQQWITQTEQLGVIDSFHIERITLSENNKYATIFIRHYYEKAPPESVLLQMINTEKGWKIK